MYRHLTSSAEEAFTVIILAIVIVVVIVNAVVVVNIIVIVGAITIVIVIVIVIIDISVAVLAQLLILHSMIIEIRFMFKIVEMWVKSTDSIRSVKRMISDRQRIPVHCQELYNNGIELDDDLTVGQYRIVGRILCYDTRGTLS